MDSYSKAQDSNKEKKTSLEYQTLDEIRKKSSKFLSNNTTNVTVDHLIISDGKAMPAYKISPFNKNYDNLKPLVKYIFNEDFSLDSPYCKYDKKSDKFYTDDGNFIPYDIISYTGKEMDTEKAMVYHETGMSWWTSVGNDDPYRYTENYPTEKQYILNYGEKLDNISYKMLDGEEWGLKEASEYALNFVNAYIAPLENNEFSYQITDFKVKKLNDECFGYDVNFQRVDKNGNLFDNHSIYANSEASKDENTGEISKNSWYIQGKPYLYGSAIELTFNQKEKLNSFVKYHVPYFKETVKNGDKLISFSSAVNIISDKMAKEKAYKFETAELEYYYVALDAPTMESDWEHTNDLTMLSSSNIQARPYWAFTTKDCYTGEGNETIVNSGCLYLVDAITGELYVI